MKLSEYLTGKYKHLSGWAISDDEAKVVGIPVPLKKGWFLDYEDNEITREQAGRLMSIMLRDLEHSKREKRREKCESAVAILRAHYDGLVCEAAPKKTRAERARSSERKIRKERSQKFIERKFGHVNDDDFLRSYEWRRVRMEAIKKYGARCQCCGATTADGRVMNVDHIKPRRIYPQLALDIKNLQVLCDVCNHGKGNWDMTDWRNKTTAVV